MSTFRMVVAALTLAFSIAAFAAEFADSDYLKTDEYGRSIIP